MPCAEGAGEQESRRRRRLRHKAERCPYPRMVPGTLRNFRSGKLRANNALPGQSASKAEGGKIRALRGWVLERYLKYRMLSQRPAPTRLCAGKLAPTTPNSSSVKVFVPLGAPVQPHQLQQGAARGHNERWHVAFLQARLAVRTAHDKAKALPARRPAMGKAWHAVDGRLRLFCSPSLP